MAKNEKENIDRSWDVVETARGCMMATQFSDGLRVRPMEALPERDENGICFITDRRGLREHQIEVFREVYLTFVYPNENVYLALTGQRRALDFLRLPDPAAARRIDGVVRGVARKKVPAELARAQQGLTGILVDVSPRVIDTVDLADECRPGIAAILLKLLHDGRRDGRKASSELTSSPIRFPIILSTTSADPG
jgi:hypothetical protein